jgi:hypothetical protein
MRRILLTSTALLAAADLAACGGGDTAADSAAADTMAMGDTAQAPAGGGIPAGYVAQADNGSPSAASYTAQGDQWVVRTGGDDAHIIYAAGDTASGSYTVSATVEQMEMPQHPEAFGLIIGGQNLDQAASRTYTYFIVRHTGEYMIRVREGADLRTIRDWTASPAIARADSTGRATYRLGANVGADAVQFMVNDQEVVSVPKSAIPAEGVAGLRINHSLHLTTGPVTITRG